MADQGAGDGHMHWEYAKLLFDGTGEEDRRLVWFSHRDHEAFGPEAYDDILWRLGEAGFEPVGHQVVVRARYEEGPSGVRAVGETVHEVTLFKRPLGTEPTPPPHASGADGGNGRQRG